MKSSNTVARHPELFFSVLPLQYRQHRDAIMADDIAEQIRLHIHEILRVVLDAKGKTLRELNELVGRSSKAEIYSIILSTLRL